MHFFSAKSFVCRITSKTVSSKWIEPSDVSISASSPSSSATSLNISVYCFNVYFFSFQDVPLDTLIFPVTASSFVPKELTIEMDIPLTVSDTISLNSRCRILRLPVYSFGFKKNPFDILQANISIIHFWSNNLFLLIPSNEVLYSILWWLHNHTLFAEGKWSSRSIRALLTLLMTILSSSTPTFTRSRTNPSASKNSSSCAATRHFSFNRHCVTRNSLHTNNSVGHFEIENTRIINHLMEMIRYFLPFWLLIRHVHFCILNNWSHRCHNWVCEFCSPWRDISRLFYEFYLPSQCLALSSSLS